MNKTALGIMTALAGAMLWGFSGCCAQMLTQDYGMSSYFLTLLRMPVSAIVFLTIILIGQRRQLLQLLSDPRQLRDTAIFGCVGLFFCQLTYIVAIAYTDAGTGTVLEQLSIVFIMFIGCGLARRLPNVFELLGAICAFGAIVFIATKGNLGSLEMSPEGLAWGLGAAAATTFYVMYPQRLFKRWGSFLVTGVGTCAGALMCLVLLTGTFCWHLLDPANAFAAEALVFPQLDLGGWAAFFTCTLVGTFAAFALYLHGVSVIGSVRGSQLGAAEPATAAVLAAVWLGTAFTWADWLGLVLMIATVFLVSRKPKDAQA